ncbi:5-formyltetrahydrofolate cyclo-ligase [Cohnella silvisoli]|uniref:5-formyltetrahydrofolate cyclo-ligase n=1 Tax=Cohnella silvisoli TaxID=2873699 RepID=A0ABV1KVY2_9BACL|nr:5-formyltetrahydrofolate cyclo-ligase [Cohnella silvisoli]MCD9023608.1 5-formyltetrahydrofolate cyclo-ligase [Cohnella silvisoli]
MKNAKMKVDFHGILEVGMSFMDEEQRTSDKGEWRRRMTAVRDAMSPDEREQRSLQLCVLLELEVISVLRKRLERPLNICAYGPFRSEASALPLINKCWKMGDQIFAPRILPGGEGMELRKVEALSNWIPGKWGVPEPDPLHTSIRNGMQPLDAVLVPGIAFNEIGGRLGYGGGYYDRLYAGEQGTNHSETTLWIGFAFASQVVRDPLPSEPHDLRLSGLATDEKVIWFN